MSGEQTITALRRWSCQDKALPPVERITQIHVYDFDNTLFASPLPNKQIWTMSTYGQLQAQDFLYRGGWWHNPRILAATGNGQTAEEATAWRGFWNERVVELAELSAQDPAVLTVLLTGRSEPGFADIIGRMVSARGLAFDMICLKPVVSPAGETFASTLAFKQCLLRDLVFTYSNAQKIKIYEDRPKHVKSFRDYFEELNSTLFADNSPRSPIEADVVHVSEQETAMEPVAEVAEVQHMINAHNQAVLDGTAPRGSVPYKIKRSVFYTGYIIDAEDTERLKTLLKLPANFPEHEVRILANNILITPRPAPRSILDRVGGIGAKVSWRVTGLSHSQDRVWAARVSPVNPDAKIYTENKTPCVVLATRRQAKPIEAMNIQTWQPVPESQAFVFETSVGEKVLLRIEEEVKNEDLYEASFPNARNARKHARENEFPPLDSGKPKSQQRMENGQPHAGHSFSAGKAGGGGSGFAAQRGGANAGRGGRGGAQRGYYPRRGNAAGGRGRGRGGYRSLDDNVGQGYGSSGMQY